MHVSVELRGVLARCACQVLQGTWTPAFPPMPSSRVLRHTFSRVDAGSLLWGSTRRGSCVWKMSRQRCGLRQCW